MMGRILRFLRLSCNHKKYTFPQSRHERGTYVACLDCGKDLPYDWKNMKIAEV